MTIYNFDVLLFQVWTILLFHVRERNGIPLQYSCLENPMDGGAWWAAVRGVAKSWTRLKWLSSSSCFMSSSNYYLLTCTQVSQEAGKVVWYSHFFKNFLQFVVIQIVKGFGVVNKAEVYVFMELSWFFYDPTDVGHLIVDSSAFSKSSLNIWKFLVHMLLKPSLKNFEPAFASVWDECNCAVVWTFFGIAFLWDWNEDWPFPVYNHKRFDLGHTWTIQWLSLLSSI